MAYPDNPEVASSYSFQIYVYRLPRLLEIMVSVAIAKLMALFDKLKT
jgi:hypothetical protein